MIATIAPLPKPIPPCDGSFLPPGEIPAALTSKASPEFADERRCFREILSSVPAVVFEHWMVNDAAGRRSFISSYVEELFGFTSEEWLVTPTFWASRIHPEDRPWVMADASELFAGRREESRQVFRWLHKDGRTVWGETHLVAVRNEAGQTCGVRGVTLDVTERIGTAEELRWKSAFLEAQTNANLDGILVVNEHGKTLFYNRKMAEVWRLPQEIVDQKEDGAMLRYVLGTIVRPEQFLQRVEYLYAHPNEVSRDEIALTDGRFLDRYSSPVFGENGTYYGRIWTFRDISDRKRAEAEAEDLNRQLVGLSREAGMAEVATSVLHNVGNVLNSVNVSIGLATEKVNHLKITSLSRLASMLNEHAADLPAFFTHHPQGSRIPQFLGQLAEHFAAEQQTLLQELASLQSNLEHINEIVAMQQHYATAGGVIEVLPLADVVEDALRMNTAAFERHGSRVVREFDMTLPPMPIDRNKILLILVNLIRNAKYACDEGGRPDKCITLRTGLAETGAVTISVSDNGVGILPENLARIFEHGFTTRKNGHGFGLHSSALAAQEMNGALRVHSDGIGTGATFILELPLKADPS
ncbi:PAS/PAC sensor signal transduction histidine kinase [Chthoniobacter flavus Ellin428]|uniref:histidine kinase n=1 Tax=Chthoniobacter flavus Ellin428 TaxID=497964 RepID=B4D7C0_9BACT|nr:PAS domain-containing sensor histidine kinase [Chthoniobacter flavus]EDY17771.1 PAS/PAC sensor signal transduction histidine kinase [Chthoniobacter flavus Ellin428]TCO87095.1 PAS domain S-box-containing protein [Chthoniobacter flavus]